MGIIYIIKSTVITQVYVGQTTKTVEHRWLQHCKKAQKYIDADTDEDRKKLKGMHQRLYLAMSKHGIVNFYVEILEIIDNEFLDEVEMLHIEEYDSVKNGLNMHKGGKRRVQPDDVRDHISMGTKLAFNDIKIIEKMRKNDVLKGLPPKCQYHENKVQRGIRVRRHRLCEDKLFEFKNYTNVDECKEAIIKFIDELELSGIPYVGGREKSCKKLPGGFRKLTNGYKIQKTFDKKRYAKEFTKGDSDELKFNEALEFINNLLISKNIPIIVLSYDEIKSE